MPMTSSIVPATLLGQAVAGSGRDGGAFTQPQSSGAVLAQSIANQVSDAPQIPAQSVSCQA